MMTDWLKVPEPASVPPPPLHFSLLLFPFFWFNFSKQTLHNLKEGKRTPERSFANQMVLSMQHGGSVLTRDLASSRVSSRASCPGGKHLRVWHASLVTEAAGGISYPHGINKASPCLLFKLMTDNLMGKSQRTTMTMIFPETLGLQWMKKKKK